MTRFLELLIALIVPILKSTKAQVIDTGYLMRQEDATDYQSGTKGIFNVFAERVEFRARTGGVEFENIVSGSNIAKVDLGEEVKHMSTINPHPINDHS